MSDHTTTNSSLWGAINDETRPALAAELERATGWAIYPRSILPLGMNLLFLGRSGRNKLFGCLAAEANPIEAAFAGQTRSAQLHGSDLSLKSCPLSHENAVALRQMVPFAAPVLVGLRKSAGCGDRLGLATPGHIRAIRGTGIFPIVAQQSIREMTRTGRSPADVMDDATWGVFQEGWQQGFGSDADHLKSTQDIDICAAAGFTLYTIDPGFYVDNEAHTADAGALQAKYAALPWDQLQTTARDLRQTYVDRPVTIADGMTITLSEEQLWRAAAKYGNAIAHTLRMYRHLQSVMGALPFELEVSVDETETPTAPHEHYFVASELKRLGVRWVSLAPRYIGRFEKGVDYIGDLHAFAQEIRWHAAIARYCGPYKLSLHSGSDKFSIYLIVAQYAGDLVHLKTAGTSYLEALRAIAGVAPDLFREILAFAFARYDEDKASYHVSADPTKVPPPERLTDAELPGVLDSFDGRQLLHVTFGSVLTARTASGEYRFRGRILATLDAHEEEHYAAIEKHFDKHLAPFHR